MGANIQCAQCYTKDQKENVRDSSGKTPKGLGRGLDQDIFKKMQRIELSSNSDENKRNLSINDFEESDETSKRDKKKKNKGLGNHKLYKQYKKYLRGYKEKKEEKYYRKSKEEKKVARSIDLESGYKPKFYYGTSNISKEACQAFEVRISLKNTAPQSPVSSQRLLSSDVSFVIQNNQTLDLSKCDLNFDQISQLLINNEIVHITNLCLSDNKIEEEIKIPEHLNKMKLESLSLGGTKLGLQSLINILEVVNKENLRFLGLADINLEAKEAGQVMKLVGMHVQIGLDLSFNQMTNQDFEQMCQVGFKGQVLILAKNMITDEGVLKLANSLYYFPNLKIVDLRGNPLQLGPSMKEALALLKEQQISVLARSASGSNEIQIKELISQQLLIGQGPKIKRDEHILYPFVQ